MNMIHEPQVEIDRLGDNPQTKNLDIRRKQNYLVSIVIPLYNEEANVLLLTEKIHAGLKEYDYEIIYVDDCSTDHTRQNVIAMQDAQVTLVELKKNYGQSMALSAGFDLAQGDYVVTLDGDLQNDPADIPALLEKCIREDWDVVAGIRSKRQDSFFKVIPSKIANFIIRLATNLDVKDNGCALKVFKKEVIEGLHLYGEMHRFITLLAHLNGAHIVQVPVAHHPRVTGQSKYGLERIFKVISDLVLIIFLRKYLQRPMHLFGNIGLFSLLTGLAIFFYLLICKLMGQDIWGRPIMIAGVVMIIGGLQFFTVGLTMEMLTRTYYESQQKKPYSVRKITRGGQA